MMPTWPALPNQVPDARAMVINVGPWIATIGPQPKWELGQLRFAVCYRLPASSALAGHRGHHVRRLPSISKWARPTSSQPIASPSIMQERTVTARRARSAEIGCFSCGHSRVEAHSAPRHAGQSAD
jgi:hypothetical protein